MKKLLIASAFALFASAAYAQDCSTLTYVTEAVATQFIGVPAHFDFEAVGGNPPYTFTITSGTLPAGLHLSSSGKLRGKPTQEADETVFITLTDSAGCTLTQAFPIRVEP